MQDTEAPPQEKSKMNFQDERDIPEWKWAPVSVQGNQTRMTQSKFLPKKDENWWKPQSVWAYWEEIYIIWKESELI